MNLWLVLVLSLLFPVSRLLAFDQQHNLWQAVLTAYRNQHGLIHYQRLSNEIKSQPQHPLTIYLQTIQAVSAKEFEGWNPQEKQAFLINAYNALTIKLVLDHYPVTSIKSIGGFFSKPWSIKFFKLLGEQIQTLDAIEHEYLRPTFKDFRLHAALNCASLSCPSLRGEAYIPRTLNQQLDEQMRMWLSDPSKNNFLDQGGVLEISKIFSWYADDFEHWGGGVRKVLLQYGPTQAQKALEKNPPIHFLPYNWDLNDFK